MNLTLVIKNRLFLLCFLFLVSIFYAQENKDINENNIIEQDSIKPITQKSAILSFAAYRPTTINNSFIGQSTKGKIGFKTGLQLFMYKGFFIGGMLDISFLDVEDSNLIGRYNRSTITAAYFEIGYDLPINKQFNIGLSLAPFGFANYRNVIDADRIEQQNDTANLTIFKTYLSCNLKNNLLIFIDYSFRNDNTNINTAPDISGDFDKIQYHNIGLGVKISIGQKAMFD